MGAKGRGRGREPLASWGDSSAGGWHVTAVTVLKGGGQATCCAPWSNYATRPPVRPSSLTPTTRRTVLISCQEDQLPSFTIQHHWTFQPPCHRTPTYTHIQPAILSPANHPRKWLVKIGLWDSGKERERGGQWGCVLNTHSYSGRVHNILRVVVVVVVMCLSSSELSAILTVPH